METSRLAAHFTPVEDAIRKVGPVVLPIPRYDLVARRYYAFLESLFDWKTACKRYDDDHEQYRDYQAQSDRLRHLLNADSTKTLTHDEEEMVKQQFELLPKLRFDIRAFYVFAKIAFVTFAGLLFAMASEKSQDWKRMGRFVSRIKRTDAPELFKEFYCRVSNHLQWFRAHVNLYRDDFIEHPVGTPLLPGLVTSPESVRLTGLIGTGLSERHQSLLERLQRELRDSYPEFTGKTGFDRYSWVCQHLEKIPEHDRTSVKDMIQRVGLESGDLIQITYKTAAMFAEFLFFYGEWLVTKSPSKK